MDSGGRTVYEAAGGDAAFARIVDTFYAGVETDPLLRPMYPEDLGDAVNDAGSARQILT